MRHRVMFAQVALRCVPRHPLLSEGVSERDTRKLIEIYLRKSLPVRYALLSFLSLPSLFSLGNTWPSPALLPSPSTVTWRVCRAFSLAIKIFSFLMDSCTCQWIGRSPPLPFTHSILVAVVDSSLCRCRLPLHPSMLQRSGFLASYSYQVCLFASSARRLIYVQAVRLPRLAFWSGIQRVYGPSPLLFFTF